MRCVPNFAANISWLFTELDLPERFRAAAEAGFKGVECLFPYEMPVEDFARLLQDCSLEAVLINAPPGNWESGERGLAALKGREEDFRESVLEAIDYARVIKCPRIHIMAGAGEGTDVNCYADNLRWAGRVCGEVGIQALMEPINTFDMPGYFLSRPGQAADIIADVCSPHLGLQLDLYHIARMGIDPSDAIAQYGEIIGHFQIAGVPDRHEPNTGQVTYPALFELIDNLDYTGWVGCEYRPQSTTVEGLGWFEPYR